MARRKQVDEAEGGVALPAELIDQLAAQIRTPAEFQAIYRQFQKALTERVLKAELTIISAIRKAESVRPMAIRRVLYTTNAIESLHMQVRRIIKTRGHFANDEAASKLLYLALRNIDKKRRANPDKNWRAAFTHLKLLFGDRLQER